MRALKWSIFILAILVVFGVAAVFALLNPEPIDLELAFARFHTTKGTAFAIVFVLGWVAGLLTVGGVVAKLAVERRGLRKATRRMEGELAGMRSLPLQDAD